MSPPPYRLAVRIETWELRQAFRIAGHVFTQARLVVVRVDDGEAVGEGEGIGLFYFGDTPEKLVAQIEAVRPRLERGISRAELAEVMPAGGARNAVDCALWDLEAQRAGTTIATLAGIDHPRPLLTTYTLSADDPDSVARDAARYSAAKAIKLKLDGGALDPKRVLAAREARPDVWLGVDANQGLTTQSYDRLLPTLVKARVSLLEQPFPIGSEWMLADLDRPVPVAADESFQTLSDLPRLVGRYDIANIKLDKCGGLTEALKIVAQARCLGLRTMVGNMGGTSLSTRPAFVLGQQCDFIDLDGPLVLARDRLRTVRYEDGHLHCDEELGLPTLCHA